MPCTPPCTLGAAILAAGQGTRMKLSHPKPLIPVVGRKLVDFPIEEIHRFIQSEKTIDGRLTVVTGQHNREQVEAHLTGLGREKRMGMGMGMALNFAVQKRQEGTADALRTYFADVPEAAKRDYTLVMCTDTPLIQAEDLSTLYRALVTSKLDGVAATFKTSNPTGYGRVIQSTTSTGFDIVEEGDADDEVKKITEVNSALYILKTKFVLEHLDKIRNKNTTKEFYLTDLFKEGLNVRPILFSNADTFSGVNTLAQLDHVEMLLRLRKNRALLDSGVRFATLRHTYLEYDVEVGEGTFIHPNACIEGDTKIGKNVLIETGVVAKNCLIEEGAKIKAYSYLENAIVRAKASIGPFAHLRPGSDIGPSAKVGNFVETKKAVLERGVKVSHLSYVGDAHIGQESNIGCGLITCNYDGSTKHKTKIGKHTFIGSDTQVIAPIKIGDRCYIGSGSTIDQDVPDDSFAIARARQVTRKGMAKHFFEKRVSKKSK